MAASKNTRGRVSFLRKLQAWGFFIEKETGGEREEEVQVVSCELWEIFKNTYFYITPVVAVSV